MSCGAIEFQNHTQSSHTSSKGGDFVVPKIQAKTPRKAPGHCSPLATEQLTMGPLTTPTKGRDVGSGEPWTPTSNLKMLISAASPDIRNREKELCVDNDGGEAIESSQETELGEEAEKLSRKEKSLGLLCHKFLARYPDCPNPALNNNICLDDVATELNVERRRIYDIMNVLESLHMVSRSAKNRYIWRGQTKLTQTLALLKKVGEKHRYSQQMQQIRQRCLDKEFNFDGEEKENEDIANLESNADQGQKEMFFVELPGLEFKAASVNSRKDKSLRVMSQKFVMLFLVSSPRVVSLEVAAKILIGEDQAADQDKSKFKTKVRRLYDIANVLRSLKLIEKVHVTEERGRKPAFEWIGPEEFPNVNDLDSSTSGCPTTSRVLESSSSVENCAKNLFSSPGAKHSFTRHPSLIKLAKTVQADRRKISSAPSSPIKTTLNDSRNGEFPNKMAQLAAICKIQLDQQSGTADKGSKPALTETVASTADPKQNVTKVAEKLKTTVPPVTRESTINTTVQLTPSTQPSAQSTGALSYLSAQCSPLIPVLLPQQRGSGPYAVYLHPSSLRSHPLARPQPTSLAVRSMTFEDRTSQSPMRTTAVGSQPSSRTSELSPLALKRPNSNTTTESSPSKAKRTDPSFKDTSPKLCEILQARLKTPHRGLLSSRPSPRALHLDPEFVNTPVGTTANQTLVESVENFLEKEEKVSGSDSEMGSTPIRAVPLSSGQLHTETLVPAGYLIPISQQSLLSLTDLQGPNTENKAQTPTCNIYHTPTAGSIPPPGHITPIGLRLHRPPSVSSPHSTQGHRVHSPSPAILNFTLQNLGLISAQSSGNPYPHEHANTLPSPLPTQLGLQQRGLVFVKPMSPVPLQQSLPSQPLTLISVQQPLMTTPKGAGLPQHSFFQTPVSLSPLATVVTSSGQTTAKTVYIPQRKLDVGTEDL